MDKVINLEKINNSFQDIKNTQHLTNENLKEFQENIEKLDWYIKRLKIQGKCLRGEQKPNIKLLEDIGFYLFGYLTGLNGQYKVHVSSFYHEGLNISALIFELLGEYSNDNEEHSIYGYTKNKYFFYSSVCYSLCGKEANSIYLGKSIQYETTNEKVLFLTISKTLQRNFKGIINNKLIENELKKSGSSTKVISILYKNALLFVEGDTNIGGFIKNIEKLEEIKSNLIKQTDISLLFIVSRIKEVLEEMINNSVWSILLPLGFSKEYILSLTKYSNSNVYELWESQRDILKKLFEDYNNRVLINIPTSAGKTQIAELLIINKLEKQYGTKVIYIVPTNALGNQIEEGFFNRFRGLGYKVASNIDVGNEIDDIEDDVIILTPEKLDLLVRKEPEFLDKIGLFIFDEFHKISNGDRGILLETLFGFLMLKQDLVGDSFQIVTLSAIVDNLDNINKWFGNDNGLFQSRWTPTRKLYGILEAVHHNSHTLGKDNINIPYNLEYKYINAKGIIRELFKLNFKFKNVVQELSNKKLKDVYKTLLTPSIFELIIRIYNSEKGHILVYFTQKESIYSFIKDKNFLLYGDKLKDVFELDDVNEKINNLKKYLEVRLSSKHPLTKIVDYGVGYHTADLPKDVRIEIENAYKNKTLKLLLSTSTLAEGVNLPIKSLVFHNPYLISISDFRNIIGRVGRATQETEGNIFFVNQFVGNKKINDNASEELLIKSGLSNIFVDNNYYDFLDYISGLEENDAKEKVKEFDRLQVFIYSVYEYMKENDIDITLDDVKEEIGKGLYFVDKTEEDKAKFNKYYEYAYNRVDEIYSESPYTLKIINKTGLSDKSFWDVYNIGITIDFEPSRDVNIMGVLIPDPYPDIKELITEDLFNQLIDVKEFKKTIVKNKFEQLDNYNILFAWIDGNSFLEIRDKYFNYEKDIVKRTSIAVKYITTMFEYILPWAFSSLAILCEGLKKSDNILREVKLLPMKVKHGVKSEYGIELVKIGIEHHELLVELENTYITEKHKFDLEVEELDFFNQQIFMSIGKWLLETSFHLLESKISIIKNNVSFIRNIGKVKNKLKEKTNILEDEGKLRFKVQGIFNNEFKKYDISKIDNKEIFNFQRQYNNIYDYFAIRVYYGDGLLGYVQSDYSEELSKYIKDGIDFDIIEIINDGANIELIIGVKVVF